MDNDNITINNIISFDETTGLKISSRGEILDDLKALTKIAYGSDYSIEQGNEWYSFLDLLSGSLSEVGGACQALYNALSFTNAGGTVLDNVVSFVGISRKAKKNSQVLIKATVDNNITRPVMLQANTIILEDSEGHQWTNTDDLYISEYKADGTTQNYTGTAMFSSIDNTDPTNVVLDAYNNGTLEDLSIIKISMSGFSFINELNSELGNQEETDAQLRSRYRAELYRESVGTIEGLTAQIKENADVTYCYVKENSTGQAASDGMLAHSIWVVTNGASTWDGTGTYSTDPNDMKIAKAIIDYKSLGCNLSVPTAFQNYDASTGHGQITTQVTIDNTTYVVKFNRAEQVNCKVTINLSTTMSSGSQRNSVEYQIKESILKYINELGIGNDVLNSGVYSKIFGIITDNEYKDFVMDVTSTDLRVVGSQTAGTRIAIALNQYAKITTENIVINWTTV